VGDLDPAKVRAAVLQGLAPLEQRIASLKSKKIAKAWGDFNKDATARLLSGDISVDEWKLALGQFGGRLLADLKDPTAQPEVVADVNATGKAVEEAFDPPSPFGWLIFAGIGATALAYWWMKKEERQREFPVATPEIIAGSRRQGSKFPTAVIPDAEIEEDAEFEEI
jgi:hypothetical protein